VLSPRATEESPKEEVPIFEDFVKEFSRTYVVANNKPSEQAAKECIFRVHLLPVFGKKRLDAITIREIEALKADLLARKRRAKTINNILTVLGRTLGYAAEIGLIGRPPRVKFLKVMAPKFDFLDFDELERLVTAAEREPDVRAAILTAGEAGLRMGELRALEWQDVDLKVNKLTVRQADWRGEIGMPKGRRARTIDMTTRLAAALKSIRHLRGRFVFCHASGVIWNRTEIDTKLWRCCRRAGLREIGWHVLRHTFCSHLAMCGVTASAIKELAGHTSLATTERYMHLSPLHTKTAIAALNSRRGNQVAKDGPTDQEVA
jgi:integrase